MTKLMDRVASLVEKAVPRPIVKKINAGLEYGGIKMEAGKWMVLTFLNSLAIAVLLMLLLQIQFGITHPLFAAGFIVIITPILVLLSYYVVLYYGQRRAVQIEEMIPDALMLVASNIRAEIPIHKALILSARPEFGLLAEQLSRIGDELISGVPMDEAFANFSNRVRSPLVHRVSVLIKESLRSGHDLAGLLEQIAHDIRAFKILEAEAKASIASYVLFIVMAVLVIAPVLYSISISFVEVSQAVRNKLDVASLMESGAVSRQGGGLARWITAEAPISGETLKLFAALNLFVSATVAALVVSVLQTGEMLQKLHYVPIFVGFTVGAFLIGSFLLNSMLLGAFGV